jgi:hypothetical protein
MTVESSIGSGRHDSARVIQRRKRRSSILVGGMDTDRLTIDKTADHTYEIVTLREVRNQLPIPEVRVQPLEGGALPDPPASGP